MANVNRESQISVDELLRCHPSNEYNYKQLLLYMSRRVVIPFLGAGFSANAGYPTWRDFLRNQSEEYSIPEMKALIDANELTRAASLLEQKVTRTVLENIFSQVFGDDVYKNNGIDAKFELLFDVFQGTFITTNFDTLIESLYVQVTGEHLEKITPITSRDKIIINQKLAYGDPILIKLHGDVAVREFVVTEKDYERVYGTESKKMHENPMPSVLQNILKSKVLLFWGCSLDGDRTLEVIESAKGEGIISFAFLELPKCTYNVDDPFHPFFTNVEFQERVNFLAQRNIIPIWYPYQKHDSLKIYLKDLGSRLGGHIFAGNARIGGEIKNIMEEAEQKEKQQDISGAYYLYGQAEDLIKMRSETMTPQNHMQWLDKIRSFYQRNGYIYEKRSILKESILQTRNCYGNISLQMAELCQSIAYAFERYWNYRLMLLLFHYSEKIVEDYERKQGEDSELDNCKAYLYINIAYAYLENNQIKNAIDYYKKAEEFKISKVLNNSRRAFLLNGLHRYYMLENDFSSAIDCLNKALEIRQSLDNEKELSLPQHIVNTYSNIIYVYLKQGKADFAAREYELCIREPQVQKYSDKFPDALRKLAAVKADICEKSGNHSDARKSYKNALNRRKDVRLTEDLSAAVLYKKIALTYIEERQSAQAMEYAMQAYIIFEWFLGCEHEQTKGMYNLIKELGIDLDSLNKRLEIQKEIFMTRHGENAAERENEMIGYLKEVLFEL